MKNRLFYLFVLFVLTPISGCFLGEYKPGPKYTAPYGAYYVKPGMTREERLRDLAACGTRCGLRAPCFTTEEEEEAERIAKMTGEFGYGPGISDSGYLVLVRKLPACMASKGYQKLPVGTCEGNDPKVLEPCMYP